MHWSCCDVTQISEQELQQVYEHLSDSRKEHIQSLHKQEDRACSLAAERLVQALLSEHYRITGAVLHRAPNGRPYLSSCDLHVSISHCYPMVACAVSREPVGIDVEKLRPMDLDICRHVCTPEEAAYVGDASCWETPCRDKETLLRFFEIWTAKEAYFKRQGTGITALKSVNVLQLSRQLHLEADWVIQIL